MKDKKTPKSNEDTMIPLKVGTRERLKKFGDKGEKYDVILNRLMNESENRK